MDTGKSVIIEYLEQNKNISFSSPDIQDGDLQVVEDVIRSGWLAHGKYSDRLEELFVITLKLNMQLRSRTVLPVFIFLV